MIWHSIASKTLFPVAPAVVPNVPAVWAASCKSSGMVVDGVDGAAP